jgi:release factor glutamine methyltransferase
MQTPSNAAPRPWTILSVLTWTADYFKSHRVESPRTSAEILLSETLRCDRIDLYVRFDQPLQKAELARFKGLIKRRIQGEPVAYITGKRGFWTLDLAVSPSVLIPRPETECLVEAALALLPDNVSGDARRVLDLGAGSGAIVLALAAERPQHRFFASDRSPDAMHQAKKNAGAARVDFFCSDWLDALHPSAPPFHLIVSNPPYIPSADIAGLQVEVRKHEPRLALDGGRDGLSAIRRIIHGATDRLVPGGHLLLEIGSDQGPAAERIIRETGGYAPPSVKKDCAERDRVLLAQKQAK